MTIVKSKLIITFIASLFLFACNSNQLIDQPKFILEIPDTSKTHRPDIFYEVKKNAVDELSLNVLENGTDSFELRLWAKVEVLTGGQVFVIKKIKNKWTCMHYEYIETEGKFNPDLYKLLTSFTIDTFWVNKLQPKTNWDNFFKAIEKENMYNLPVQSEISGWKSNVGDGYTYYVEYATNNKYKFYYYNCPDVYENDFKECKQMTNILDIFHKEFGLSMGFEEYGYDSYRCK